MKLFRRKGTEDHTPTQKEEKELGFKEKFMIKRIINHGIKNIKKTKKEKQEQKNAEKDEENRQKIIQAILQLTDNYDLYTDDTATEKITEEWLQTKDLDFVLNYLEEILNYTRVRLND